MQKYGTRRANHGDGAGSDGAVRRDEDEPAGPGCVVDADLHCPPSRYDCARPCPLTGWERREGGRKH